jgi:flagella synthesis protein FlgN
MDQDARRRLEDLLDREIEAARSLADNLAAERAALVGGSSAAVHEKASEKIRLLGAIENLERERCALWDSANPNGLGIAATIAERWRALLDLLAGCRNANEVNGQIIHVRQNQIRQLLDIVRGGPAMTYGPQGKTLAGALRALARA